MPPQDETITNLITLAREGHRELCNFSPLDHAGETRRIADALGAAINAAWLKHMTEKPIEFGLNHEFPKGWYRCLPPILREQPHQAKMWLGPYHTEQDALNDTRTLEETPA